MSTLRHLRGAVTAQNLISHTQVITPAAFERILQYLEDYLGGLSSPGQTAENLSELILSYEDKLEAAHWEFLNVLLRIVARTRDDRVLRQLAELIAAFSILPDAINTTGETLRLRGGEQNWIQPGEVIETVEGRWWTDMPMFGMMLREEWNGPPGESERRRRRISRKRARDEWASIAAFVAHLIKLHEETGIEALRGFEMFPLWLFRDVLEGELEADEDVDRPFEPELHIPAVASMVRVLGPSMRWWSDDFDNESMASGGPLYHGQGYSPARAGFWALRLERFSTDRRLSAYSRALAREAAWTLT